MAKKYIEVTETNFKSFEAFNAGKYPEPGFYLNTDETGLKSLIFNPTTPEQYPVGLFDFNPPQFPGFLRDTQPADEVNNQVLEISNQQPATGNINDILKIIAVTRRPELVLNLTAADGHDV